MSAVSQPNCSRIPVTVFFAPSSLPQMNMVGRPPLSSGLTMRAAPTELKALTNFAPANSRCSRSTSASSRLVKTRSTPFTGGASAMGFVASMTGLPDRFEAPAARRASALAEPLTARTTKPPKLAASPKLPTFPLGFFPAHSFSFVGSRVPIMTS